MSTARARRRDPSPVFAALGDPTRLSLLEALADGGRRSIVELHAGRRLTRQAITKHLRVLERAGLVQSTRQGRESRFAVRGAAIEHARGYLDQVTRGWDAALLRLRNHLER